MSLFSRLLFYVGHLANSWYAVDRIRIAPVTGRLLRISMGDSVVLFNELYSVSQRRVDSNVAGRQVIYVLRNSDGAGELRVFQDVSSHELRGELNRGNAQWTVSDGDIVIVNSGRCGMDRPGPGTCMPGLVRPIAGDAIT